MQKGGNKMLGGKKMLGVFHWSEMCRFRVASHSLPVPFLGLKFFPQNLFWPLLPMMKTRGFLKKGSCGGYAATDTCVWHCWFAVSAHCQHLVSSVRSGVYISKALVKFGCGTQVKLVLIFGPDLFVGKSSRVLKLETFSNSKFRFSAFWSFFSRVLFFSFYSKDYVSDNIQSTLMQLRHLLCDSFL